MKIFNKIQSFFYTIKVTLEYYKETMQKKRDENLRKLKELRAGNKIKDVKFTEK